MTEPIVDTALAKEHGLSTEEYEAVVKRLGRTPTFTELGIVSVMWSEHASYKNSVKYLKTLPKEGSAILCKAGEENSGVVDIGDGLAIAFKIESHNHPSAVEPYHGAATGVGGILRDIFTMGARPICALDSLRFGNFNDPQVKHLIKGVVEGIADYGNCFGVPTVGGEVYFEDAYKGNPLVNVMAVGLLEHKHLASAKATGVGNYVVYVGAKTGRDGIHGATFASVDLSAESEEKRTAVQVGDPFMEKLLLEATLETIQKGLVVGVQDMGAAGLACSSSEMSAKGEVGIELNLECVPQRESEMTAYEMMLSESQERMLMIVKPENYPALCEVFEKWDLHAEKIGVVTNDKMLRIKHNGLVVAEIPSSFLALGGETPVYDREYTKPAYLSETQNHKLSDTPLPEDYNETLKTLISSPNIASKRAIYKQYDHMVQVNTVIEPGSDAALIRIKNTNKAIAVSTDCNGRYCYLDAYEGTKGAVAESARNVLCTGARPVAITNCLNFGNPYKPEVYYTFVQAIKGIKDACECFETPVTGGNVSFYNENTTSAVYPTPTIGMLGILNDVSKAITMGFKEEADIIYLLGYNCSEIGGSEYQKLQIGKPMGKPPKLDLERERTLQKTMLALIDEGILLSAHDCSEGGLAVAIAECCFPQKLGCTLDFPMSHNAHLELFGEAHSRIIVTIKPSDTPRLESICQQHFQRYIPLGEVGGDRVLINGFIDCEVALLQGLYENSLNIF